MALFSYRFQLLPIETKLDNQEIQTLENHSSQPIGQNWPQSSVRLSRHFFMPYDTQLAFFENSQQFQLNSRNLEAYNQRLLGMITVAYKKEFPVNQIDDKNFMVGVIFFARVHSFLQRQGLGSFMFKEIQNKIFYKGYKIIQIVVRSDNFPMVQLLKKQEYKIYLVSQVYFYCLISEISKRMKQLKKQKEQQKAITDKSDKYSDIQFQIEKFDPKITQEMWNQIQLNKIVVPELSEEYKNSNFVYQIRAEKQGNICMINLINKGEMYCNSYIKVILAFEFVDQFTKSGIYLFLGVAYAVFIYLFYVHFKDLREKIFSEYSEYDLPLFVVSVSLFIPLFQKFTKFMWYFYKYYEEFAKYDLQQEAWLFGYLYKGESGSQQYLTDALFDFVKKKAIEGQFGQYIKMLKYEVNTRIENILSQKKQDQEQKIDDEFKKFNIREGQIQKNYKFKKDFQLLYMCKGSNKEVELDFSSQYEVFLTPLDHEF